MEIRGRIIQVLPLQQGVSKAGNNWKKQDYVLETFDQYPRKVCFNLFGDRVDQFPLQVGEDVIVSFDLESREFNGRWYTDVRGWKVDKADAVPTPQGATFDGGANPAFAATQPIPPVTPQFNNEPNATDDLPF